mmetsp:Transcript_111481/g.310447  ORF Transcript_111481/g.310447 Transcript_111481/m.310447 type:complete len:212 (-) Transcript_111481:1348-1983(-)
MTLMAMASAVMPLVKGIMPACGGRPPALLTVQRSSPGSVAGSLGGGAIIGAEPGSCLPPNAPPLPARGGPVGGEVRWPAAASGSGTCTGALPIPGALGNWLLAMLPRGCCGVLCLAAAAPLTGTRWKGPCGEPLCLEAGAPPGGTSTKGGLPLVAACLDTVAAVASAWPPPGAACTPVPAAAPGPEACAPAPALGGGEDLLKGLSPAFTSG